MKITRLVLLFNYQKILAGIVVAGLAFWASTQVENELAATILSIFGGLIILNVLLSLLAAYLLYDTSDLYRLNELPDYIQLQDAKSALFIHASFDPISRKIDDRYPDMHLTVCDIFENRHVEEKMVNVSKRAFPPNPKEIKIDPTALPFADDSQDVIFAVTALHEILDHDKRVQFFEEANRVLRKDGVVIVSEQMRNWVNFAFFNIGAFHFLSLKKWRAAIGQGGMKIREIKAINLFADMVIVVRRPAGEGS